MNWKYRLLYLAARCYWRIFRPITLGVKLLLVKDGTIWLVKHSYQHGWFLPGGFSRKAGPIKHQLVLVCQSGGPARKNQTKPMTYTDLLCAVFFLIDLILNK